MERTPPRWNSEAEYAAALTRFLPEDGGPVHHGDETVARMRADIDATMETDLIEIRERLREGVPDSKAGLLRMGLIPTTVHWFQGRGA